MRTRDGSQLLAQDLAIVGLSVALAIIMAKTGALEALLTGTQASSTLSAFIAGFFFTSVFTIAPAAVALGEIAKADSLLLTAVAGACGALLGDLVIYRVMRDRLTAHMLTALKGAGTFRRWSKRRVFRYATFIIGALIIISPLPDELGIGLMGLSRVKPAALIPISFISNFIGVLLVGLAARALA